MGSDPANQSFNKVQILSLATLTLISSIATASPELDRINQLLAAENPQGAFNEAKLYQSNMEGDPEFDYLYGIAAVQSGHLSESILAFERVVSLQPDSSRARFELAKAYYAIGDYVRARREFERLLTIAATEKAIIDSYLAAIRQRETQYQTTASAYLQLGLGYDSDINTGPSGNLVYQSLPILLAPEATDTPDAYGEIAVGGQIDYPLTRRVALYGAMNGRMRQHRDIDAFDNNLYSGLFGARWRYKSYLVKGTLLAQQYTVNGDVSRNMVGITIEGLKGLTAHSTLGFALNYLTLAYPNQPLRDSNQYTLGSTYTHRWTVRGAPSLYVGLFGGEEVAKQQTDSARSVAERALYGFHAGFDYKFSEKWGIRETLLRLQSEYAAPLFGFLPERSDTFTTSELTLSWLATKEWKVSAIYSFSQNESNIDMYNYTRNQYGVTVRYDF